MVDTTIYFATNRMPTGDANPALAFGPDPAPPVAAGLTFAQAFVKGTDIAIEGSGAITNIAHVSQGAFDAGTAADIVGSGKNLLIFIHGFANSFSDAITRAAFNHAWFAQSGIPAADTTVIAFTWPSLGKVFAPLPHFITDDYFRDQAQAGLSGVPIASFLASLGPVIDGARAHGRRVFLLAHSMGNWALQAAVMAWFAPSPPARTLFDEVFQAAADEVWGTFGATAGGRLSRLRELTPRISIYSSIRDVVLEISEGLNHVQRLGEEGPEFKSDPVKFPSDHYRFVDCARVGDYPLLVPLDASHQYYRRSRKVRTDIATTMAGNPPSSHGAVQL